VSAPDVSVVVPTWRRRERLAFALEALAEQTLGVGRFEVIVVGAGGETEELRSAAPEGLNVRFYDSPAPGAAAQRNLGWRAARASLVAFTDDDCRPRPDWLERLLEASGGDDEWVQGVTVPDAAEVHLLRGHARSMEVRELDPWAPTCNIAYPRALLERLGGFDESFPGAWGEDTDLALRAREIGARPRFAPAAVVEHAVHPRTLAGAVREAIRRNNVPAVLARHPRQRAELMLRVFGSQAHACMTAVLLTLPTARRSAAPAVLAWLAYLVANYDRSVPTTHARLAHYAFVFAPRLAVLDAVEVLALAASSVRHRALVL
jgi:GT2 family glycosyltransferase